MWNVVNMVVSCDGRYVAWTEWRPDSDRVTDDSKLLPALHIVTREGYAWKAVANLEYDLLFSQIAWDESGETPVLLLIEGSAPLKRVITAPEGARLEDA